MYQKHDEDAYRKQVSFWSINDLEFDFSTLNIYQESYYLYLHIGFCDYIYLFIRFIAFLQWYQ